MTVKTQVVHIATADGNDVVVASGLAPGALVVMAGVHVLAPGQKVSIYKENQPVVLVGQAQAAINKIANETPSVAASAAAK
jgi:hypothetical protein